MASSRLPLFRRVLPTSSQLRTIPEPLVHHTDPSTADPEHAWRQWHDDGPNQAGTSPITPLSEPDETQSHYPFPPPRPFRTVEPAVSTSDPSRAWREWHDGPSSPPSERYEPQRSNETQPPHYPTVAPLSSLSPRGPSSVSTQGPDSAWRQWQNGSARPQQSGPTPHVPLQLLRPETPPSYHHLSAPQSGPNPLSHTHSGTGDPPSALGEGHDTPASPRPSLLSPNATSLTPIPEIQLRDGPNPENPQPSSYHKRSNVLSTHSSWPSQDDSSPLDPRVRTPEAQVVTSRGALDTLTPAPALSYIDSSGSTITSTTYRKRPQQWRDDFKFKSGFASVFRRMFNNARASDGVVDSAKLDLHPFLCYNKSGSMTTYNLRRKPDWVKIRDLNRALIANYMGQPATHPATQHMRIYHPCLPWYIDITADGSSYISLGQFFRQLFASLNAPVSNDEFYSDELGDEDRRALMYTCFDRYRSGDEETDGVKRIDFLRGKYEWKGLVAGKKGMWCLKTS